METNNIHIIHMQRYTKPLEAGQFNKSYVSSVICISLFMPA